MALKTESLRVINAGRVCPLPFICLRDVNPSDIDVHVTSRVKAGALEVTWTAQADLPVPLQPDNRTSIVSRETVTRTITLRGLHREAQQAAISKAQQALEATEGAKYKSHVQESALGILRREVERHNACARREVCARATLAIQGVAQSPENQPLRDAAAQAEKDLAAAQDAARAAQRALRAACVKAVQDNLKALPVGTEGCGDLDKGAVASLCETIAEMQAPLVMALRTVAV
jgi:hypothetical protein